jgi:hypothetical protein
MRDTDQKATAALLAIRLSSRAKLSKAPREELHSTRGLGALTSIVYKFSATLRILSSMLCLRSVLVPNFIVVEMRGLPIP